MPYILERKPVAVNTNLPGHEEFYRLEKDFNLNFTDEEGSDYQIFIPSGFICDGSSIPRILWTFIGLHKDGKNREPSLVHDWLYAHQGKIPERTYKRKEADRLYYDMLEAYGVSHKKAIRSYKGVRWFGGSHWRRVDEGLIALNSHIQSLQKLLA